MGLGGHDSLSHYNRKTQTINKNDVCTYTESLIRLMGYSHACEILDIGLSTREVAKSTLRSRVCCEFSKKVARLLLISRRNDGLATEIAS
jgi:hypothetical protein